MGHDYNEKADRLAKIGTVCDIHHKVAAPIKHYYTEIAKKTQAAWRHRWKNETTCRQARQMLPELNPIFSKYLLKLQRSELSTILQFVTGHNYLQYHLFNTGRADSPNCRLCEEAPETAWHILSECPSLSFQRMNTLIQCEVLTLPHPRRLTRFLELRMVRSLLEFPNENSN